MTRHQQLEELAESLTALDENARSIPRNVYHERQLSLHASVKSREFLRHLDEWMATE